MDNNMFQRLKDLVTQHQNIGVIVSPNPSFDEMAAGLGMYLVLKQMGKSVSIVCPTDPTVGVSSLVGIDKVQRGLGGAGGDLVVSFPYREGEIEKVSYTVDNGKLNIVVKAGQQGLSFSQSDVQYQQGGAMPTLIFMIGVADINSVNSVINTSDMQNVTVVNIDNKSNNAKYGDVVHVDTKFSSVCEEIADFLTLLEPQVELDTDTSQNLLSGILSATNDFQTGRGSYLAFEMAGILMKKGAVRSATGMARPMIPPMQSSSYFPPQPTVQQPVAQPQPMTQPMAQPVQQPVQSYQPLEPMVQQPKQQSFSNTQGQQQQPVENTQSQSFDQNQNQSQLQQGGQTQDNQQEPPSDWLTPKVYKGSTVL